MTRRQDRDERRARARRRRAIVAVAGGVIGSAVLTAVLVAGGRTPAPGTGPPPAPAAASLPVPSQSAVAPAAPPCSDPVLRVALDSGRDEPAIAAAGGADAFRSAVTTGRAPCVTLSDPARLWVVVNKQRPLVPADAVPGGLTEVPVRSLNAGILRADAADALGSLFAAAAQAGAGEMVQLSGYRSYGAQADTYADHVAAQGQVEADLGTARPGFSEHQTGLAADVVACDGGCGGLDDFAGTAQQQWVAAHAWEFGFIVRYEDGRTSVTGYEPEPWHLRFVGPALARAYHEGGWHSLEEFFGLPPAPDYAD